MFRNSRGSDGRCIALQLARTTVMDHPSEDADSESKTDRPPFPPGRPIGCTCTRAHSHVMSGAASGLGWDGCAAPDPEGAPTSPIRKDCASNAARSARYPHALRKPVVTARRPRTRSTRPAAAEPAPRVLRTTCSSATEGVGTPRSPSTRTISAAAPLAELATRIAAAAPSASLTSREPSSSLSSVVVVVVVVVVSAAS